MTAATYEALGKKVQRFAFEEAASEATAFVAGETLFRPMVLPGRNESFNEELREPPNFMRWLALNTTDMSVLSTLPVAKLARARGYGTASSVVAEPAGQPTESTGMKFESNSALQEAYESIDQADARSDSILSDLLSTSSIRHGKRIVERLRNLALAAVEECEPGPSSKAMDALRAFLRNDPALKYPDLTLGPGGALLAEWRESGRRLLGVYFSDSPTLKFVVFRPNARHPQIIDRYSGTTTIDELVGKLLDLDGLTWAHEQ
ncbi:MAG: hypothetical protein ACREV9_01760 [Burkholderiales bacterium]